MEQLQKLFEAVKSRSTTTSDVDAPYVETKVEKTQYPVLLNWRSYALNKSRTKFVSVGLKPHSGFPPVVEIFGNKNDFTVFEEGEWMSLLSNRGVINNYLVNPKLQVPTINIGRKNIHFQTLTKKVIRIDCVDSPPVILGQESVQELWRLATIINGRIELLKALEFENFYNNIIRGASEINEDCGNVIVNVVSGLKPMSEPAMCMLELLKYVPEVINCDIEMARLGQ